MAPKKNAKPKPRAKQARVVTPVDGQVAGLDADDDVVAFFEEVRCAAPHTPANFARLDFILIQDDLVALPNVPNGWVEAREATVRMVEVGDSDDEVDEVGNPQPEATKQVRVEAYYLLVVCNMMWVDVPHEMKPRPLTHLVGVVRKLLDEKMVLFGVQLSSQDMQHIFTTASMCLKDHKAEHFFFLEHKQDGPLMETDPVWKSAKEAKKSDAMVCYAPLEKEKWRPVAPITPFLPPLEIDREQNHAELSTPYRKMSLISALTALMKSCRF